MTRRLGMPADLQPTASDVHRLLAEAADLARAGDEEGARDARDLAFRKECWLENQLEGRFS